MSTAELQAIVADLARSTKELRESTGELRAAQAETNRRMEKSKLETDRQMKESKLEADREMKESKLEADREMKESKLEADREMKESKLEADREMKESKLETDRQMKESKLEADRQMKESRLETDREMKESQLATDRSIDRMNRAIDRMSGSIGREWGHLVESLTKPSCLGELQAVGIKVTQTAMETESERPGCEQEWDVLLINGREMVAVEVKSRFRQNDLERVEEKLTGFKKAFPQYSEYKVYGAVGALKFNAGLERLAEKHGMFVFQPSGEIMRLTNRKGFRPKAY